MEMTILKEVGELRSLYKAIRETSKVGGAIMTSTVALSCMIERAMNSFMPSRRGLTNLKCTKNVYEGLSK